jgi:cytochrome c oxidase subunit 2
VQASANRPQIPVGRLVEFRVTSLDVNHGFGVYDPDGKLMGQT